jgi:hypothetical protein
MVTLLAVVMFGSRVKRRASVERFAEGAKRDFLAEVGGKKKPKAPSQRD